ncbi:hypothetical protein BC828DRAFT_395450 [Blastocladiella britannica]|nr:hypothetical protein BC828DRAFT_395450 [Blastocladiella britannica]
MADLEPLLKSITLMNGSNEIQLLQQVWEVAGEEIPAVFNTLVSVAAAAGTFPVLEWYLSTCCQDSNDNQWTWTTIASAARGGQVGILEWITARAPPAAIAATWLSASDLASAAAHCQVSVLEYWWAHHQAALHKDDDREFSILVSASRAAYLPVLAWWWDRVVVGTRLPYFRRFGAIIDAAVLSGQLKIVEWWWTRFCSPLRTAYHRFGTIAVGWAAITCGSEEIMHWLWAKSGPAPHDEDSDEEDEQQQQPRRWFMIDWTDPLPTDCDFSTTSGSIALPVLQWWAEKCSSDDTLPMLQWTSELTDMCIGTGAVDVLDWVRVHLQPEWADVDDFADQAFQLPNHRLALLDWWWANRDAFPDQEVPAELVSDRDARIDAIEHLEWWHAHVGFDTGEDNGWVQVCEQAAAHAHLPALSWMLATAHADEAVIRAGIAAATAAYVLDFLVDAATERGLAVDVLPRL